MIPSLRFDILRRDGFTCRYCGRNGNSATLEVDHIDPKANGGLDAEENLVTACFPCNRGKRDVRGVLPPPIITTPVPFPVGLFCMVMNFVVGWESSDRLVNMAYQGYVMAVQGDEVWISAYNWDNGSDETIVAVPKNNWHGWTFYPSSREMRWEYLMLEVNKGISDSDDIKAFRQDDRTSRPHEQTDRTTEPNSTSS